MQTKAIAYGLAAGTLFGGGVAIAADSVALGVAVGVGVAVALAFAYHRQCSRPDRPSGRAGAAN